jgi:hypothetical protein
MSLDDTCPLRSIPRSADLAVGARAGAVTGLPSVIACAYFLSLSNSANHEPIFFSRLSNSARTSARGLIWPWKKARVCPLCPLWFKTRNGRAWNLAGDTLASTRKRSRTTRR